MYVLYRTDPAEPSTAHSPASSVAWKMTLNDAARSEYIYIGRFPSFPDCLGNVTALEVDHEPPHDVLHTPQLFQMLQLMPRLQDLTITMAEGPISQVPLYCALPPVTFRLRRLVLSSVFHGWIHLLRCSRDTLECLFLGTRQWVPCASGMCRVAPRYIDTFEGVSLGEFTRLRALRFNDAPEESLLSACTRLTSLSLRCEDFGDCLSALRSPLRHLTIDSLEFDNGDPECIADALVEFPALRTLRTMKIEVATLDIDIQIEGHPRRMYLLTSVARGALLCLWCWWAHIATGRSWTSSLGMLRDCFGSGFRRSTWEYDAIITSA